MFLCRHRGLLLPSCAARTCSLISGSAAAASSPPKAYTLALKEVDSLRSANGELDRRKFERMLRFCAFSPALDVKSERADLVRTCVDVAQEKNVPLTLGQHNLILQAYVVAGHTVSCDGYLQSMTDQGASPDGETYQLCAMAECAAGNVSAAISFISKMSELGYPVKEAVHAAVLETLCRVSTHQEAREYFDDRVSTKKTTACTYLALLRGTAQYGDSHAMNVAVAMIPKNKAAILDAEEYGKVMRLAGLAGNTGGLHVLLRNLHVASGSIPGLLYLLRDFYQKNEMQACAVLLSHMCSGSQQGPVPKFGAVQYFVQLIEKSPKSFDEKMADLVAAHNMVEQAFIADAHLSLLVNSDNASPLQISLCLARYQQAKVAVRVNVMDLIRQKLEADKSVASVAKWIQSFQSCGMHVPDWLWHGLVYTAADLHTPIAEVRSFLSQLKMDIFTTASVLQSIESCKAALPTAEDYLGQLLNAMAVSPPPPATPNSLDKVSGNVKEDIAQPSTDDSDDLESVLGVIDAMLPASVQDASDLLSSTLPSLMMTNVNDAFLLASHVCEKRPDVAQCVPISCLHCLLVALHDSQLPLHFFRLALSLRSIGISPPENWLDLSLSMHIKMDHSQVVDDIFTELCSSSTGDSSLLPKALIKLVYNYWLSSNRPTEIINNHSKLTDPAASDGQLLGIVIAAYVDLGDADNAMFLLEKCISSKCGLSEDGVSGIMGLYCRDNKPDAGWSLYSKLMQCGLTPSSKTISLLAKLLLAHDRCDDVATMISQTRTTVPKVLEALFLSYMSRGLVTTALDFALYATLPSRCLATLCALPFTLSERDLQVCIGRIQASRQPSFRHIGENICLVSMLMKDGPDSEVKQALSMFAPTRKFNQLVFHELCKSACQSGSAVPMTAVFRLLVLLHELGKPINDLAETLLNCLAQKGQRQAATALVKFCESANVKWSLVARMSLEQLGLLSEVSSSSLQESRAQ